ncbi:MAG TPA: PadR family transcriptional regulator [Conexibacter sp.]|nr:PadR family transcriptional regulator [Conexibacter sp.]
MHRTAPQMAGAGCGAAHPGWRWMTGRHGHGPHGPGGGRPGGPWGWGWGWGPMMGPGGSGGFRRGRKARRGDVRTAALLLLAEEPRNGYQIMQEIEERSGGAWRPSAGSVYPALQLLEDEGLVRSEEADGRKLLHLTDAGRRLVAERGADQPAPWEELAGDVSDDARAIMEVVKEVVIAVTQVLQVGDEAQRAEARRLLVGVRRDLYRLLAERGEDEAGA